jgi:transcriptional regulator with PAS, ATPase and Fis domain
MLLGESVIMQQLRARVARVARTNFTVLIEGESGAGKELVARELHASSARGRGPFVAVNCAALVESLVEAELFGIEERTATGVRGRRGKFELADRGTLFLDEVADLSPTVQAKLLRVLQDMTVERVGGSAPLHVDIRIVAATNRSLHEMVTTGAFRADLYYRLSGVEVTVPPLRSRREDVPVLVSHFLQLYCRSNLTVASSAMEALVAFDWPGNVRQMARVIERAIALAPGSEITLADLPDQICRRFADLTPEPLRGCREESLRAWSSRYVRVVLDRCGGNKRRACDVLDISYHTLQSHLEYGAARAVEAPPRPGPRELALVAEGPAAG